MKVISATQFNSKLKCTVQATGKLGFSEVACKELELGVGSKFIKFGREGNQLYLGVVETNDDGSAFALHQAGVYYYLLTKVMFESLGYDFKRKSYIFDLVRDVTRDADFGGAAYRMSERTRDRRNANAEGKK